MRACSVLSPASCALGLNQRMQAKKRPHRSSRPCYRGAPGPGAVRAPCTAGTAAVWPSTRRRRPSRTRGRTGWPPASGGGRGIAGRWGPLEQPPPPHGAGLHPGAAPVRQPCHSHPDGEKNQPGCQLRGRCTTASAGYFSHHHDCMAPLPALAACRRLRCGPHRQLGALHRHLGGQEDAKNTILDAWLHPLANENATHACHPVRRGEVHPVQVEQRQMGACRQRQGLSQAGQGHSQPQSPGSHHSGCGCRNRGRVRV